MRVALFAVLLVSLPSARASAQRTSGEVLASRLVERGEQYVAAGDPVSAVAFFRDAIQAAPDTDAAYAALVRVYVARRALRDALETANAGLRRAPDSPRLWSALADVLEASGDLDGAARALTERAARVPDDFASAARRSALAQRRGSWTEALACARRMADLAVDPTLRADALRQASALELLAVDPVRRGACGRGPVEAALRGCR